MRQIVKYNLPVSMEQKKMMVSMILGTDMAHHLECIEEISSNMERYKNKEMKKKDRQFLFNYLLHASDLNNQAK